MRKILDILLLFLMQMLAIVPMIFLHRRSFSDISVEEEVKRLTLMTDANSSSVPTLDDHERISTMHSKSES